MKAASRTALLCIALVSSLARAAGAVDLDVGLKLKNPVWADEATPRAQVAHDPQVAIEAVAGTLGAVLVMLPGGYVGYLIGNTLLPPFQTCDVHDCLAGYPSGGLLGTLAGGFVGISLGAGLGVALFAHREGGALHWGQAVLGAGLGGLAGLLVSGSAGLLLSMAGVLGYQLGDLVILVSTVAGAVTGAVWMYQASLPFGEVKAAPVVAPVPGGGVLGISVTL